MLFYMQQGQFGRSKRPGGGGGPPATGSILSLDFDGADGATSGPGFVDDSPYARTFTASGVAAISTAQFVDGGSSLSITLANDCYATAAVGAECSFSGDFAVQADIRVQEYGSAGVFLTGDANGSAFLAVGGNFGTGTGTFSIGRIGVAYDLTSTGVMSQYVWHRVRVERISGTMKLYIDGVERASASNSTTYDFGPNLHVGSFGSSGYGTTGFVDNVRI